MESTLRVSGDGGVSIAVHHIGGDGPPLMIAHATGFHGRCYEPMARVLTERFSVWALDQRGHGESEPAPDGHYGDWSRFAGDLLAVMDAIGPGPWSGVGHSLGGGVSLLAEQLRPGTFSALCLYEPVAFASPTERVVENCSFLAALSRRRRATFASRAEAAANYGAKPPMQGFDPDALAAYVDYGFKDDAGGGVTLCCDRETEARIFESAAGAGVGKGFAEMVPPILVLAGTDPKEMLVDVAGDVARSVRRGGLRSVEGHDHFGPFTDPHVVGAIMLEGFDLALR